MAEIVRPYRGDPSPVGADDGTGHDGGLAGLLADLCVKIDLQVGAVDKLADAERRRRMVSAQPQPALIRTRASASASAAGIAVLRFDLAGPDQGHLWFVRSLVIGGLSPTVTAAGRADVYVTAGSSVPALGSLAALGLSDWRDQAATLPDISFYGRGELPLRLNEELFVVISNGTTAQQYVAVAQVEDFREAALREEWGL